MTDLESENLRTIKPEDEEPRPTASDIMAVIDELEGGGLYVEPEDLVFWDCRLREPEGHVVSDGQAESAGAAMAIAWINYWAPDVLVLLHFHDHDDRLDEVPLIVPLGWRFELIPPLPHSPLPWMRP
jgi:hypothetical protein